MINLAPSDPILIELELKIQLQKHKQDLLDAEARLLHSEQIVKNLENRYEQLSARETSVVEQAKVAGELIQAEQDCTSIKDEIKKISDGIHDCEILLNRNKALLTNDDFQLPQWGEYFDQSSQQLVSPTPSLVTLTSSVEMPSVEQTLKNNKKFYQTTAFKICLAVGLVAAAVGAAAIFIATPVGFALAAAALVHLKIIALILFKLTLALIKAALAFGQSHIIPALIAAFNFCKAHPIITIGIFVPIVMLVMALEVFAKTVHNKNAVSLVVKFLRDKFFTKKPTDTATRPSAVSFRLAGLDAKTAAQIAALPSDDPRFIKEYNDRFVL